MKKKMTAEQRKAYRLKQEDSLFRDPALSMSWTGMNALSPHVHYQRLETGDNHKKVLDPKKYFNIPCIGRIHRRLVGLSALSLVLVIVLIVLALIFLG